MAFATNGRATNLVRVPGRMHGLAMNTLKWQWKSLEHRQASVKLLSASTVQHYGIDINGATMQIDRLAKRTDEIAG